MRNKVWYSLTDCKTNEFYTAHVIRYYQWSEWISNSVLVIATSSSIAAWTVWKNHPALWASIIGLSQLLMLLKPFLLFPKYIKVYSEKNIMYQYLSWELEKIWYNIQKGLVEDNEAFNQYDDIKKKLIENDKFPHEIIIINHKRALTKAENKFNQFLNQL